jgi:hypothetical protein
VRDFITSSTVQASLRSATGTTFDPNLSLALAYIRHIESRAPRSLTTEEILPDDFADSASRAIHFSRNVDPQYKDCQLKLLRKLDKAARIYIGPFKPLLDYECGYWAMFLQDGRVGCESFLRLLVAYQLAPSLKDYLGQTKVTQKELDTLLFLSLQNIQPGVSSKDTISVLLDYGANPDERMKFTGQKELLTTRERALKEHAGDEIGTMFKEAAVRSKGSRLSVLFGRKSKDQNS